MTAGAVASAVAHYRETIRLSPASADLHVHLSLLSDALMDQGRFDEALVYSLEALRLAPNSALAYCTLGELACHDRYAFSEDDIRNLQALAAGSRQHAREASLLYFTLAAHWEQKGQYGEAFRCYRAANDLKWWVYRECNQQFIPSRHRQLIDDLIAAFSPEFFAKACSFGSPGAQPIFVIGMVRSGTSLVEQILASLPGVFGAGERDDLNELANALPGRLQGSCRYPACMKGVDAATIRWLADVYQKRIDQVSGGVHRVVDKMPHNYLHLGLIAALFPRARIIHCRRNILDVCLSAYLQNFKWLPYASRLEDIGFCYREYERLMEHWRQVLPLPIHEVVYEDLVANQETVSRALIAFCGLEWDDRCLAFYKTERAVQTSSKLQVRQPIHTHSVGHAERFEAFLQPLRDALADPERLVR
jgi:tetratricopeptide (TPR) repeat protein